MENRSNYSARTDSVSLLSEAEKAGWAVVFGLIGCAIIVSNAFTLAVFLGSKLKERRSTFLLINLTKRKTKLQAAKLEFAEYRPCQCDMESCASRQGVARSLPTEYDGAMFAVSYWQ
ncbi:hypothetical protein QZH41_017282 [Actinostola sp. cb2023]|nr:hypothetical protein QZH41_017282 [Actinostola sp. cb2023]